VKTLFTPKEVARLIGISYRQIQYWDKTNFIKPSYRRRGKYRLYIFSDLIQLRITRLLRQRGTSIQQLRRTVRSLKSLLPQVPQPLHELTFLIEGERMLVFSGEPLMNPASAQHYLAFRVVSLVEDINKAFPEPVEAEHRAPVG
jgi:DNA-binding transcriptional MerR regulator